MKSPCDDARSTRPEHLGECEHLLVPSPFEFVLLAFASFRLTHFVVFDRLGHIVRSPLVDAHDHPNLKGFWGYIGEGITCYWCAGMWMSILLYLAWIFIPRLIMPPVVILAVAGVQAAIERSLRQTSK